MRKIYFWSIFIAITILMQSGLQAQVKLAEWTFDYTYDQSTSNDSAIFRPTTTALTSDPNVTISNSAFKIFPDNAINETTNYTMNAVTTYCQLNAGYGNYVSRIMFAGPSTVADYSVSENHKNYYQFAFPTTGYDSIKIDFSLSGGQNSVDDYLELVYSTDGGTSWVDAGNFNTLAGWWLYQPYQVTISARNKENVILRLVANTTSTSGTANFNLDYLSITGKEYSGGTSVDAASTITWPFNGGTEGQAATFSAGTEGNYSANWVSNGNNLAYKATNTTYDITYTLFQPGAQSNAVTEDDMVSFNIRPKTGLTFTPTSISFDCMRFGTDGGAIDIIWKNADGSSTTIATAVKPARNNSGAGTHATYDLSTLSIPASNGACGLYIYIYSLGNTKQVGLANIFIEGHLKGSIANIPSYKLTTSVTPVGAGTLTVFPVGNEFDEGTSVTLTAATRSFGYQFKEWQDGDGNVLSTTSPYSFTIQSDTTIKAVYEALTTYSFTVDILGSQWGKISLTPAPTDGKYEAGTSVVMAVTPNPVTNFSYWDDNTTSVERTITVDGDKTFSATFDEIPFIAGWDFNPTSPTSSRQGDYYSETSNTGTLNVYNQDGTATSWLGHAGAFSPVSPCAYLWTLSTSFASNRHYWEATFSTLGYSNIMVKSQMAGSYQHYLTQKMQVSVDGTTFTDLNTLDVSTSAWSDLNATLPKEYEGKEKIYIRWIADTNSTLVGDGNDGTALTNIFVFADKEIVNDVTPPTLLSTVPAEGVTNASAYGSIVLTFNEKMKAGAGSCKLGDTELTPTFGSKTVTFAYSKLSYNTDYTFTVPNGGLTDMSGNAYTGTTIHFKTMDRPKPTMRMFDAVVATDESGDHKTIQEAINAAPKSSALPYLIFVKNGVYSGHVDIPSTKPFMHLIGQERDSVIISGARLCGGSNVYPDSIVYSVQQGATVVVNSSNCYFENITFENKFGYDNLSGPQALALYTIGDKIILNNCWLRSYQDTYLSTYGNVAYRHYLKNCRIEGAVDFIYGGGDVFFDKCLIYVNRESGGYIVAPSHQTGTKWGYVFSSCTIDGPSANYTTYFGRPWANSPMASFFNTIAKVKIYPAGWLEHMGAIPAIFADYNTMDKDGNALDLSSRIDKYWITVNNETVWGTVKKSFTDEEAAQYTYENVTSGKDNWDPRIKTESTEAPVITVSDNTITWRAVDYAICYVILRNNRLIGFTTETSFADDTAVGGTTYTYQVRAASEYGSLSDNSSLSTGNSAINVVKQTPIAYVSNTTLMAKNIRIGSKLTLVSINGSIVMRNISIAETYSKEMNLQKGLYILLIDNEAFKVMF